MNPVHTTAVVQVERPAAPGALFNAFAFGCALAGSTENYVHFLLPGILVHRHQAARVRVQHHG